MSSVPPTPAPQIDDPRVPLAERRTAMASFRTAQALDRIMAASIRTTLTMNSFGLGMIASFALFARKADAGDHPDASDCGALW